MLLRKWTDLPSELRNDDVKKYYDILTNKKINLIFKKLFDFLVSLFLIILLSPIMLVIAIWIKIDSQGPVFFKQTRITQYNRQFKIYKFRTMVVNAEQLGESVTQKNDSRITKVGEKIRNSRLDELPQLFNIIKGEMSFVGTRPEVKKYVDSYTNEMYATLLLPAGITSIASITYKDEDKVIEKYKNDKNTVDDIYINYVLPEKMKLNLKSLQEFTFLKDIATCIKTVF